MSLYVSVLGTHAWDREHPERQWWHPSSPFSTFMAGHGHYHARPDEPFLWSGDLDGALWANGNDWEAGGVWLSRYLRNLAYADRNVIAHSHGGQVALLAAVDVPIRSLVMIATPVRKEIERDVLPGALPSIGTCVHVSDSRWYGDWIGLAGAVFDGRLNFRRTFEDARIRTVRLPDIGHSTLLCEPTQFRLWQTIGLLDALRGVPDGAVSSL